MKPNIDKKELENYVLENSSYKMYEKNGIIELHFIPNTPEAENHFPDGEDVEHIMYGNLKNGRIYFFKFVTVTNLGKTETELLDDDPIMEWMKYI